MNHKEINALYEQSVYEIRLRVAIALLPIEGLTHRQALQEADKFIELLQSENMQDIIDKFS